MDNNIIWDDSDYDPIWLPEVLVFEYPIKFREYLN